MSDAEIVKGEHVLATKYSDGDPGDHWAVGFYDKSDGGRHYVTDSAGEQLRGNGFRRVARIKPEHGAWLLATAREDDWERCRRVKSVWDHLREREAADRIEELEGIVRDLIEQVGRTSLELTQIGHAVLAGREPCMKEAEKMDALLTKARAALGE